MNSTKEFIRSVVYADESSENYVDTRVRIYNNLKRKTSIPPYRNSVERAIKRAHLQTFTQLCCCEQNVKTLDPEEFGWKLTDGQLWFNGDHLLRRQGKQTDSIDADSESSDLDERPPKKKPRAQTSIIKSNKVKQITRKKKRDIKRKATTQRISCYHLTILAKKLMKNYLV